VVRVSDQVIATIAIVVLVCALAAFGLISLFLLELSAICTREFHGRRVFPLLFLFLFLLFLLLLFFVVVGIIVLGVTVTRRKIIRSG
jgi:hypothetical protein